MGSKTEGCVFCQISRNLSSQGNVIREGKYTFVLPDIKPITKGHALIITKEHHQDLSSSSSEALQEAILLAKEYALSLKEKYPEIQGFNYVSNEGSRAQQVVFHFHLHVIPRY